MNRSRDAVRTWLLWVSSVAVLAGPSWSLAAEEGPRLSHAERRELWAKNMARVERLQSEPVPEKTVESAAPGDAAARVEQWLATYRRQLAAHKAAIRKDFEWYVDQAKTHLQEGQIREALIRANDALNNTSDEDGLLASDWVRELEGRARELANRYRDEGEWRKAHGIYYELTTLFEDNKEYEKGREACLNIARLNVLYADDKRWPEVLEGVHPHNATDAMDRIEAYYVEQPDFRSITEAGLERLLLLGQSESMRKTFPGLGDDELREDFDARIHARLVRVQKAPDGRFRAKDAKAHFRRVLVINKDTVELPEELIVYEFLNGALEALDDFTSVIWPIEFREFDKHTRGGFVGVGISISGGGEFPVTVVTPLEDTPAYYAGILPEDQITHVNGESLEGISLNKVVSMITGPMGTNVTLTIHRPSTKKSFDVPLVRDRVELHSVKALDRDANDPQKWDFMIDPEMGIGYARVNSFQENTVEQLRDAVDDILAHNGRALILDLRFNPGGLMKAAIEMCQLFLNRDDLIVSTRGLNDPQWQNPKARSDGPYRDLPLIVLVNEYSASASEIVSGALQDHQRAIIVGNHTFGKFSVQKLMQLSGSMSHLKLTTALYYLPSGRRLHHEEGATEWGVGPDSVYETVPKELRKIQQIWRKRDILGKAGESTDDADKEVDGDQDKDNVAKSDEDKKEGTSESDDSADDEKLADAKSGGDDEEDADDGADKDNEDEDVLALEPDTTELPDVDLQLESALLLMRLHLMGERELRVAAAPRTPRPAPKLRKP